VVLGEKRPKEAEVTTVGEEGGKAAKPAPRKRVPAKKAVAKKSAAKKPVAKKK